MSYDDCRANKDKTNIFDNQQFYFAFNWLMDYY